MSPKHKPAALPPHVQAKARPIAAKPGRFLTVLVIASIAVTIVGILVLKDQQQPSVALSAAQSSALAAATSSPAVVNGPFKPTSPADQLNQALAAGQPVLVFMHSTNCQSCIDMMKVVDQVYPEFAGQIALVDVDVYDEANGPLMDKLGLRYIPTVVAFDREGKIAQNVGAMKAVAFRSFLLQHALGG
jgi:thioredoxin-like negative regulator of GroEL